MDACSRLSALADRIARSPRGAVTPRRFLVAFGLFGAGVRPGLFWPFDAARGGYNRLPGTGFAVAFDDSTRGQARHFAGIVAVSARVGPTAARWASVHIGRDHPDSADGRLTDEAVEFSRRVLTGQLAPADAPAWIAEHLCGR